MAVTFPDRRYDSLASFCDAYFEKFRHAVASIDQRRLERAAAIVQETFQEGRCLFICGNGGSAAIANHLMFDLTKNIQLDTQLRPNVASLSTNVSLITAIGNDIAFEDIFVFQLRTAAKRGDTLLSVSSSGDSENVVRAIDWAVANELQAIALTGFSGGRTAQRATVNVHVDSDNYGVIEDLHQSIMHVLAQFLRMSNMDPSLIAEKKF